MNQTPCVSKNGTCARITKPHRKTHAQHKSRRQPTIQPSPAPAIRSVNGNSNSQEAKNTAHTEETKTRKKTKSRHDTRSAVFVSDHRGSMLRVFKNERVHPNIIIIKFEVIIDDFRETFNFFQNSFESIKWNH